MANLVHETVLIPREYVRDDNEWCHKDLESIVVVGDINYLIRKQDFRNSITNYILTHIIPGRLRVTNWVKIEKVQICYKVTTECYTL